MLFNGRALIFTFSGTQVGIAEHERLQSLFKMSMVPGEPTRHDDQAVQGRGGPEGAAAGGGATEERDTTGPEDGAGGWRRAMEQPGGRRHSASHCQQLWR